jgi:hypothetical protein
MIYMSLYVHLFEYYLLMVNSINLNIHVHLMSRQGVIGPTLVNLVKLGQTLVKTN